MNYLFLIKFLLTAITACVCCGYGEAQSLPPELWVDGTDRAAPSTLFHIPVGAQHEFTVRMWYQRSASDRIKQITVEYDGRHSGAEPRTEQVTLNESFYPMDIVAHSHQTNTVYVVGWMENVQQVVVEKWEFSTPLMGAIAVPGGSPPVTAFTTPRLSRSVLTIAAITPVVSACSNPHLGPEGKLYMLEFGGSHTIWSLDLATGVIDGILDSASTVPQLVGQDTLDSFDTTSSGYITLLSATRVQGDLRLAPVPLMYYRDSDYDGIYEERIVDVSPAAFMSSFPPNTWIDD